MCAPPPITVVRSSIKLDKILVLLSPFFSWKLTLFHLTNYGRSSGVKQLFFFWLWGGGGAVNMNQLLNGVNNWMHFKFTSEFGESEIHLLSIFLSRIWLLHSLSAGMMHIRPLLVCEKQKSYLIVVDVSSFFSFLFVSGKISSDFFLFCIDCFT